MMQIVTDCTSQGEWIDKHCFCRTSSLLLALRFSFFVEGSIIVAPAIERNATYSSLSNTYIG